MARPIPSLDAPVVDPQTGKMTQVWFEYFATREKLSQLPDVAQTTAPLDGQVLVWSSALGKFVYGTN